MGNLIKLADKSGDARHWSVEQMLEDTLADVRSGKINAAKALVLFLDDTDNRYSIQIRNAGLRNSEKLALLDIAKSDTKRDMGY
jgi:hypothetical protein